MVSGKISRRYFLTASAGSLLTSRFMLAGGISLFLPSQSSFGEVAFPAPETITLLFRITRILYPHDSLSDVHYETVIKTLVDEAMKNPSTGEIFSAGFSAIADKSASNWPNISDDKLLSIIHDISGSEFITRIKSAAILNLYNSEAVWQRFGYQGESFSKGGYIDRGFDDLDWLPDPPVEASPPVHKEST